MEPQLPELMKEIDFIHDSLMPDPKNYHTWAYLNWLYSSFSNLPEERGGNRFSSQSWKAELEWCERMLDSDHRFIRSPSQEGHDWLGEKVQLLSGEDEAKGEVIGRGDGRNNSAWSWRWYLVVARNGAQPDVGAELE
jgi:protein farnesyltransferase/geranylgeranyltransferase type-1 subunit alpha